VQAAILSALASVFCNRSREEPTRQDGVSLVTGGGPGRSCRVGDPSGPACGELPRLPADIREVFTLPVTASEVGSELWFPAEFSACFF
jgi:hypothetical protein